MLPFVAGASAKAIEMVEAAGGTVTQTAKPTEEQLAAKAAKAVCLPSAILLRFVESFRVRKNGGKSGETKIVITDNTYYIDSEGYLLDKDQQYLVDGYGNQIRLEERHLKLLKEEEILQ